MSKNKVTQELEVDTDYGIIAAKVWNIQKKGSKTILAIHGWMDNAGSFDKLIPLLDHPDDLCVVALDLPGHGKSSQLPKGVPYYDLGFMAAIRLLVRKLGLNNKIHSSGDGVVEEKSTAKDGANESQQMDKFILMGHSLGAGLALFYASLYPEDVEQLIFLDFMKAPTLPTRQLLQQLSYTIDKLQQFTFTDVAANNMCNQSSAGRKVVASQELAINGIIHAHQQNGYLGRDDALCLFKRSSVPNQANSYYFMRDSRLPYLLNYRDHVEPNIHFSQGLDCHGLVILGKRGLFNPRKKDPYTDNRDCIVDNMRKHCKTFHLFWLDNCDHYLHMSSPGFAAEIINQALLDPENIEPI